MKPGKRRRARLGAFIYIAVTVALLAATISLDAYASERRASRRYRGSRLTTCGFVRGLPVIGPQVVGVPCQFWNLMPLTLVGVFAGAWLVIGLVRGKG